MCVMFDTMMNSGQAEVEIKGSELIYDEDNGKISKNGDESRVVSCFYRQRGFGKEFTTINWIGEDYEDDNGTDFRRAIPAFCGGAVLWSWDRCWSFDAGGKVEAAFVKIACEDLVCRAIYVGEEISTHMHAALTALFEESDLWQSFELIGRRFKPESLAQGGNTVNWWPMTESAINTHFIEVQRVNLLESTNLFTVAGYVSRWLDEFGSLGLVCELRAYVSWWQYDKQLNDY